MRDLAITLIQHSLEWLQPKQNREQFQHQIEQIKTPTDLIILPEMFTTGFTMEPQSVFEDTNGLTLQWMHDLAQQKDAAITGSFVVGEKSQFFNRLIFMPPNGDYQQYDKRHLFRMADEQKHYSAGDRKLIVEYRGWRICPMICYDLRFPVWSRNKNEYDLLIYVANWPAARKLHWQTLLHARAIENLCFVIGVNRTGVDGNAIPYDGNSMLIDAQGNRLLNMGKNRQCCSETLSYEALLDYRKKFPAFLDADEFTLKSQ